MSITLDYLDLMFGGGGLVALGWIAHRFMDNAELRDLRRFAADIDAIDQWALTGRAGEQPVVTKPETPGTPPPSVPPAPSTDVAVVDVVRVTLTERARNTARFLLGALGGLVLPLVALGVLVVSPVTDWWRDRKVIDVEPESAEVTAMVLDGPLVKALPAPKQCRYRGRHWRDSEETGTFPLAELERELAAAAADVTGDRELAEVA